MKMKNDRRIVFAVFFLLIFKYVIWTHAGQNRFFHFSVHFLCFGITFVIIINALFGYKLLSMRVLHIWQHINIQKCKFIVAILHQKFIAHKIQCTFNGIFLTINECINWYHTVLVYFWFAYDLCWVHLIIIVRQLYCVRWYALCTRGVPRNNKMMMIQNRRIRRKGTKRKKNRIHERIT